MSCVFIFVYLLSPVKDLTFFYGICVLLGFANGYWALFVTIAAELFGTNLRATVATTVPNFVRGAVIPLTLIFMQAKAYVGVVYSAAVVGMLTLTLSLLALYYLEETFHKDLDYVEED
jgi:hypothetical protein